MEGRRRSGLICGRLVVVACGLLLFLFFFPLPILSLIPPRTNTHTSSSEQHFSLSPENHQFCLFRVKALCGFFSFRGVKEEKLQEIMEIDAI